MAIVFAQQRKKQKKLFFIFIGIVLITALIIWQGILKQKKVPGASNAGENNVFQEEIKINFSVLKNPLLKKLQAFPEIESLKESTTTVKGKIETTGKKGRENPFLPY